MGRSSVAAYLPSQCFPGNHCYCCCVLSSGKSETYKGQGLQSTLQIEKFNYAYYPAKPCPISELLLP